MNYRWRDILNFVESSQCRTLLQAAQKLEISQPALSESIKRLENDANTILFYRSRTGIQLTPSGKIFLMKAHKAAQAFADLSFQQNVKNIFNGVSISIGCHQTVAQYTLPKALGLLQSKAPDYKIELTHDLSRNIQAQVQRGNIDVGIVINAVEVPDLVIQKLAQDEIGVWLGSKAVEKDVNTIICNTDLFQVQSIFKKWKNKPEKIIHTDSLELIARLADENIGYGILPARAIKLSGKKLIQKKNLPVFRDEISLIYRPEFGKNSAEKLVLDCIKQSFIET
jgi:DNA-binding transcriptional LysR family regulator